MVNRCLKYDLKWLFKKLEKKPAPEFTDLSFRKMLEVSMIQKLIFERNVKNHLYGLVFSQHSIS